MHNCFPKNTLDENMNEHIFLRIDEDSSMDCESEEDVELTYSPFLDLFTGGFSAINNEQIAAEAVDIQNNYDQEREKNDQLNLLIHCKKNNEKKHGGTCEVSNAVFSESSSLVVLGEDLTDSTLLGEDPKRSKHGEDSRGYILIGESNCQHNKEDAANINSYEENSPMEVYADRNKKIISKIELKTLEGNNETPSKTITEWDSTNKEKTSRSNENIVQSKYNDREKLKNLHISPDDANDLESDSGFSSINLDKSLQDANMDVDSNISSDSDCSIDNLNESLHENNIDEGSLVNFSCSICCQKYKYADNFKNHMLHHGVSMFSCNQCGFATADIILHQQHMAKHGSAIDLHENQSDTSQYKIEITGFKCKVCHFRGDKKEDLDSHMKSHIKAYSCDNCDFSGYKRLELKRHIMSHVCMKKQGIKKSSVIKNEFFDKSYKCDHCTFTCVYEKDFNQHTKSHITGKSHNCDFCNYGTDNRKYFNEHVRGHTIKPYKCLFCPYSFHKPSELSNHVIKKHTDHKPFKCEYCEYTCKVEKMLNQHLRKHKEKNLSCKYCEYSCFQNSDLVIHTFYKHREYCTATTFNCEECGKEFIKKRDLRLHQNTHTKQYSNQCPECDYSCSRNDNLELHKKKYHTKKEKNLKCSECDYTCFNHIELKRHSVIHTDKKFFSCEICDYVCRKKFTLQEHQLKEHNTKCANAESKAKCDKCEYVAVDKRELKRHSVIHTVDDFFKCDHCHYVCKSKRTLQRHQLKEHKTNTSMKCDKCEYVANEKRELTRHSVVHTGEKFLKCQYCQYVCRNKKTLNVHDLKQHSNHTKNFEFPKFNDVCINESPLESHQLIQHITKAQPVTTLVNNSITNLLEYANEKDPLNEFILEQLKHAKKDIYKEITSNIIKDEFLYDMKEIPLLEELKYKKVFACGICEFLCLDSDEICQHLVLKHETENRELYECKICDYKCLNKLVFEEHIKDHTLKHIV